MKISKLKSWTIALLAVFALTGCEKEPVCPGGPGCEPTEDSHTLVIYMVADNNLWRALRGNINMAILAVQNGIPANTRILVYWDGNTDLDKHQTTLTEIVKVNGKAQEKVLKTYDQQNSADPEVMKGVLRDVAYFAPAEVYGISLLGHGTGWFPPELNNLMRPCSEGSYVEHDLYRPDNAITRAYGPDGSDYMSSAQLVEGLSEMRFEYIIFDACFMSSIELLYDLRDNANYFMVSPAEVMAYGIPYHKTLPFLFNRAYTIEQRLKHAVNSVVNYYTTASTPSAAFAVVKASGLDEVADATKSIFAAGVTEVDCSKVQPLEVIQPEHAFFDLKDYLDQATLQAGDASRTAFVAFEKALDKTVVYQRYTPQIYSALSSGGYFAAERICGIASYIPRDYFPITKEAYYNTAWARYTQPQ